MSQIFTLWKHLTETKGETNCQTGLHGWQHAVFIAHEQELSITADLGWEKLPPYISLASRSATETFNCNSWILTSRGRVLCILIAWYVEFKYFAWNCLHPFPQCYIHPPQTWFLHSSFIPHHPSALTLHPFIPYPPSTHSLDLYHQWLTLLHSPILQFHTFELLHGFFSSLLLSVSTQNTGGGVGKPCSTL